MKKKKQMTYQNENLGKYAANNMWNSSSRPPSLSFSSYYGYKQASFGIKSMFYTYLNW